MTLVIHVPKIAAGSHGHATAGQTRLAVAGHRFRGKHVVGDEVSVGAICSPVVFSKPCSAGSRSANVLRVFVTE